MVSILECGDRRGVRGSVIRREWRQSVQIDDISSKNTKLSFLQRSRKTKHWSKYFCTLCSVTIPNLEMKSVSQKNELRVFWREAVQMELFSLTFAIFTFFHVVRDFKMVRNYFNLLLNYRSMCFQWECRFDFDVMCAEFLVQANTPHQLMWISSYMPNATRDHKSDCRLAYMRAEKIRCRVMCTQTGTARAMLNMCKPIYHYCDLSFRSKFVI